MTHDGVIVHDFFAFHGGGERVVASLARGLGWGVITDFVTDGVDGLDGLDITSLEAGWKSPPFPRYMRLYQQKWYFEHPTRELVSGKRNVIFSGNLALFAHRHCRGRKLLYCHTPPRLLYDLREWSLSRIQGRMKRLAVRLSLPPYQRAYEKAVRQMDVILANSLNVQKRIRNYLGLESEVVYPPVNPDRFENRDPEGYYLSTARLIPAKRVKTIVEAFLKMPDQRLRIVSSGMQADEIRSMIQGRPNIEYLGWVDDRRLADLLSRCIATIYIPVDEDFGISPLESMASGKPVIGVREGGLTETILDGETGLLIEPEPTADDVIRAVRRMSPDKARRMASACRERAALFSEERFIREIWQYLV